MDKKYQIPYNQTTDKMYDLPSIAADGQAFARCVARAKPYAPLHVKIKLTWRCNLRCEMCNVWRQERENVLTPERLRSLADELADLGCRKVHLSGGEVLLRSDLYDLIGYLTAKGMRVNLTTNGTLLTRDAALRLADSGLRAASISIDSPQRRVHDRIRGQGAWRRTLKGLGELRRAQEKRRVKLRIRVNTVVSRTNYESLDKLATFVREHGADRLTLIPVDDPDGQLWLNKARLRDYNARIGPRIAEEAMATGLFDSPNDPSEAFPFGLTKQELNYSRYGFYALGLYEQQPCYAPWTHALVTPRGRVYACCMARSERPLGDLQRASFRQIWEGATYQALRRTMCDVVPYAICHHCDDFLAANRFLHQVRQQWDDGEC
jgi:radical SAM protein with 4Fe4S-binding SPASM domain